MSVPVKVQVQMPKDPAGKAIVERLIEDMAMYELRLDDASPEVGMGLMVHSAIHIILDKYHIDKSEIDFDGIAQRLVERRHR